MSSSHSGRELTTLTVQVFSADSCFGIDPFAESCWSISLRSCGAAVELLLDEEISVAENVTFRYQDLHWIRR